MEFFVSKHTTLKCLHIKSHTIIIISHHTNCIPKGCNQNVVMTAFYFKLQTITSNHTTLQEQVMEIIFCSYFFAFSTVCDVGTVAFTSIFRKMNFKL